MLRILWRSILVALTLALLLAPAVMAHSELISATPGPDDEVVGSPPALIAQFTQNLDPSRTTLEVRDATGTRVARGGEPGAGKREFRLALPELAPGEYEVRWTTFSSEDQELGRGSYTFTVLPAPTPSPSARASATPKTPPTATPTTAPTVRPTAVPAPPTTGASALDTALPIAATALVVAIALVWLLRRRRP